MRLYIVSTADIPRFLFLAGSTDEELVLEGFDERVLPVVAEFVAEPRLECFFAAYTGILDDYGIEVPPAPPELNEITQSACAWMMVPGEEAPALKDRIARVSISKKDISNYLGDVSRSVEDDLRQLHQRFMNAVGRIGPAQTGLFRCDL